MSSPPPDLTGKNIVITGANTGIGKQAAISLASMGATVAITSRDAIKGEAARSEIALKSGRGDVAVLSLDLASFVSVRACADDILERFDHLDVLMNNAGAIISGRRSTEDGFELTFGANHLGPFLLTTLLLDRLKASAPARIVNTASTGHRFATGGLPWADLNHEHGNYNGTAVYSESKLANVLFTMALAERMEGTGVTATCCHPGGVRSEFAGGDDTKGLERIGMAIARPFMISPVQGSRVLTYLASSPEVEGITGAYFVGGIQALFTSPAQRTPSKAGRDVVAARRLWDESEKMIESVSA